MENLVKFIDCYIPITSCNFNCSYCYVTQNDRWSSKPPEFKHTAKEIRKALSIKRLGGTCLINLCGGGETLIPHETLEIMQELLLEGHFVMVVTNGTLDYRFDEIITWDKNLLERLFFKFSFHYEELIKNKKLDLYFENISKIKKAGCSFTIELMPNDNIVKDIDNIKKICLENVGALCHVTVGRDESKASKPLLTNYTREEYYNIWKTFESDLFEFKMKTFAVKIEEFCYAGKLSYSLNLGTGTLKQCYVGRYVQNIFDSIDEPLQIDTVGHECNDPHCCNSHVFIPMGIIPEIEAPTYTLLRNRKCKDGSEWLNEKIKQILSTRVIDEN